MISGIVLSKLILISPPFTLSIESSPVKPCAKSVTAVSAELQSTSAEPVTF
jgi:hypothetical protein